MMVFPDIDPVALAIGPVSIRWYALAYIAGIVLGWWALRKLLAGPFRHVGVPAAKIDDFITWAVIGIVLGGRVGYVLFYNFPYFLENPLSIFAVWEGGMAFHGGALGVILALFLFAWRHQFSAVSFGDALVTVVPFGLLFGRIANFINGELVGRPTGADFPFSMVFPHVDALPRHPSQLYEAAGEGLLLLVMLQYAAWKTILPHYKGAIAGLFLAGYGIIRFAIEFTRMPDIQLGFLAFGLTMGQLLCIPMILAGVGLMLWSRSRKS